VDEFHNNENPAKYTWNNLSNHAGFSTLAGILKGLGADTTSLHHAIDSTALSGVSILIVVDPDTVASRYIGDAEIAAIEAWVRRGGSLMLLGNGSGVDCEFIHLNKLAEGFGISFNGDNLYPTNSVLSPLPANQSWFSGASALFARGISSLSLNAPAQSVLALLGNDLMATALVGNGRVFAMGDPWLYDEHIAANDNTIVGTRVVQWLLTSTTSLEQPVLADTAPKQPWTGPVYSVQGKRLGANNSAGWLRSGGIGILRPIEGESPAVP
jgi:unsaturated rhamnogalacturonyl hydrolase